MNLRFAVTLFGICYALAADTIPASLKRNITLHASFDKGADADIARGDKRILNAPDYKSIGSAAPGLGVVDAAIEKGAGIGGSDALRFKSKNTRALFFRGDQNISLAGGTVSFWLRLDPQKDLAPGFCDPIQVTDKAYNDSAIWVDFTKDEVPRHFRLGVFGNLKSWNPTDIPPDKNPAFMQRLVVVQKPPFGSDRWTHVAVTWTNLGKADASASLFLNGKLVSAAKGIAEPFEWDPARLAVRLGVNYVGLMDDVAAFDRPLSAGDVAALYRTGSK